jgi:Phosphotransferase enzyme family
MPAAHLRDPDPGAARGIATWSTPAWRYAAVAWIDDRLAEAGEHRTGDVEQPRVRAWATVLRVPTSGGTVWFKAAAHETAAEVPLYGLLSSVVPGRVLGPLAADPVRGWLLLPDGGLSLAESLHTVGVVDVLERVLPEYGAMQLELAPFVPEMLALGVEDMRPARMTARFDEAAAAVRRWVGDEVRDAYERALAWRPLYAAWTHELAGSPVPHSVDHNDLHADNMLVPSTGRDASVRFYDWGDAVVSHPFASMLHGLGWVPPHLGVPEGDPQVLRLRDAYLSAFAAYGSHRELVRTLELACRVAKVARCLSWARAIGMGDEVREFERAPVELFAGIPHSSYLSPV